VIARRMEMEFTWHARTEQNHLSTFSARVYCTCEGRYCQYTVSASRKPRPRKLVRDDISKKENNPDCFSTTPFEILFKGIIMEWGNGKSGASVRAPGPSLHILLAWAWVSIWVSLSITVENCSL
jgi:hypothetical protein